MLDTTEFNAVAKGQLPSSAIDGKRLFATHIQRDQLERTPDPEMRTRL
jgi:hypothetical protein